MLNGGTLNYFAVPWGIVSNPLPLFVVIAIEAGLMGAVELYRRSGSGPAGYSPGVGKFESNSESRGGIMGCGMVLVSTSLSHLLCWGVSCSPGVGKFESEAAPPRVAGRWRGCELCGTCGTHHKWIMYAGSARALVRSEAFQMKPLHTCPMHASAHAWGLQFSQCRHW